MTAATAAAGDRDPLVDASARQSPVGSGQVREVTHTLGLGQRGHTHTGTRSERSYTHWDQVREVTHTHTLGRGEIRSHARSDRLSRVLKFDVKVR